IYGEEAYEWMDTKASGVCWLLFESGVIKNSPDQYGIQKP
ncbi:MAG: tripartite tricarboxylate transporter substrate binding protein, partial [Synergistaceae bacterium]|nr:tripartite tricarboxylate transporter substrate binding protein [Synergistaceae bacterium]